MEYLASKDYLEVVGASVISDVDFDVIARLYQPLVGYKACMLYFTLVNYMERSENELFPHEYFFTLMQITASDFLQARKALEAAGLIKTYLKVEDDLKKYTYVIYAPKSPKDFFSDVLFKGLLVRYLGEKEATKLALHYKSKLNLDGYKDVSASFVDVFQPDLNDASFDAKMPTNLKDNKALKVDTQFSYEDFFTHLKTALMVSEEAFSKAEVTEIERIATLYGLDVITMADIVMQSFNERNKKGNRVDLNALKERAINQAKFSTIARKVNKGQTYIKISGRTALADELKLMEEISPKMYLQSKQDGVAPVTADLNLINYLSENMGLSHGVINALISYCLKMCNNRLNKNYVEKVASSLRREKITTALDAMNYFEARPISPRFNEAKTKRGKTPVNHDDNSYDEAEYEDVLKSFKGK
ncbi:MAG: DnaD domain protein [Bacilli bacterium]|nr:DnaD domain protein [Bacilli bacterium]